MPTAVRMYCNKSPKSGRPCLCHPLQQPEVLCMMQLEMKGDCPYKSSGLAVIGLEQAIAGVVWPSRDHKPATVSVSGESPSLAFLGRSVHRPIALSGPLSSSPPALALAVELIIVIVVGVVGVALAPISSPIVLEAGERGLSRSCSHWVIQHETARLNPDTTKGKGRHRQRERERESREARQRRRERRRKRRRDAGFTTTRG